jgi:formylglycine-generating enzyme required for sulfatase activity
MNQSPILPEMVAIPGGHFLMGCQDRQENERPVHRVWVDPFELGKHQVTNREYRRFVEAAGYPPPPAWEQPDFSRPNQPVVTVSWFDAVAYCQWLNHETGLKYRLPSEAEWERAARGGVDGLRYPWGNEPPEEQPDYALRWRKGPEEVGLYQPNRYGLYNMCDNVHEWCLDWHDPWFYHISPERNPLGPSKAIRRSSRGGSWRHQIKMSRCSARSSIAPEYRYEDYGFRVARSW